MGLFSNHNYEQEAEYYFDERKVEEEIKSREAEQARILEEQRTQGLISPIAANRSGAEWWGSRCILCQVGCRNQICNSCKPLYDRGLRVRQPEKKVPRLTMNVILNSIAEHIERTGNMPKHIVMHPQTYRDYVTSPENGRMNGYPYVTTSTILEIEGIPVILNINEVEGIAHLKSV